MVGLCQTADASDLTPSAVALRTRIVSLLRTVSRRFYGNAGASKRTS
jgi:hypothetical protein